jgi:hypothetical protein
MSSPGCTTTLKTGIIEDTEFALGWICPIFKKNNKTEIANYHLMMVLNSDYKIFMKALTNKLTEVALCLIYKDKCGFMKGRKITMQYTSPWR